MVFKRIFGIVFFSLFLGVSAAIAGSHADGAGKKASHVPPKSVPSAASQIKPQAPIVMGRSVTVHRKTKLHHVKIKPLETGENAGLTDKVR
jgi:hypothetical protein